MTKPKTKKRRLSLFCALSLCFLYIREVYLSFFYFPGFLILIFIYSHFIINLKSTKKILGGGGERE